MPPVNQSDITIEQGLDFMLSHFTEPIWPRNIATAATQTKQHTVEDKQRALLYFNSALIQDCRLAIYPNYEQIIKIGSLDPSFKPIPNHLFIELDLKNFDGHIDKLNVALKSTLRRIKQYLSGGYPTVLWSGGGYHIHQALDIEKPFEQLNEFKKYENVSVKFLRYAARQLSAGKSDPNHNISFKSCLCRVPGSINSKYQSEVAEVKIVQRWNGVRAKPTSEFITEFLITLTQKDIDKNVNKLKNPIIRNSNAVATTTRTAWIECLLQTPIADYRRNARDLILIPYLIVRLGLEPKETYDIVMQWADKCSELRPLQPSRHAYEDRVRTRIQEVVRSKVPPMTFSKLKEMNPTLYETLLPLCKSINTSQYNYDHMSDHDIKKDTEFENGNESGNGFDTQEPQQEERRELTREELSLMDLVTHKNKPTLVLDFNKDPKKRIEAKHTFDIKIGPVPITYFVATLPDDPDYEQYYRVTSSKLRRAIINRYLAKDKTRLEITRTGSTQRDTVYRIRALEDDKVRVITSDSEYWEPLPQQQQRL